MKFFLYPLLIILILNVSLDAYANKGKHSMLLDKPYFTLYIEASDCHGPIQFNGQEISFEGGSASYTEYPVNHWIKSGENTLLINLLYGKNKIYKTVSKCKMTLRVRKSGSDPKKNITIATLGYSGELAKTGNGTEGNSPKDILNTINNFESDTSGDIIIGETISSFPQKDEIVISRNVILPKIALPRWAFFDSDNITNLKGLDIWGSMDNTTHDAIVKEILPIYRKVWLALKNKNVDSIMPDFVERSNELDDAFYNTEGKLLKELKRSLEEAVNDPQRELQPINENKITAHVFDNNKLVNLQHNNNRPVIHFKYNDGLVEYYDIILRKEKGKWIITR